MPPELLNVNGALKRFVPTKVRVPLPLMVTALVEAIWPWAPPNVTVTPVAAAVIAAERVTVLPAIAVIVVFAGILLPVTS